MSPSVCHIEKYIESSPNIYWIYYSDVKYIFEGESQKITLAGLVNWTEVKMSKL